MITVKPYGGLGNRIRVLFSFLDVNRHLNDEIKIIWDHEDRFNCSFEELFKIPENTSVVNIQQGFVRNARRYALKQMGLEKFRRLIYDRVLYGKEIKIYRNNSKQLIEDFKNCSVYIETCYAFSWHQAYNHFLIPHDHLRQRVEDIVKNFSSNTIGIHIRRTDHISSLKYSPIQAFKELIVSLIRKDGNVRFFLATDSKKVEDDLIQEFSDKIMTSGEKELTRNSPEGIKSALVDLLCLSKTKKIYGSYGSSFSSVPNLFTGVEFESVVVDPEKKN